MSQHSVLVVSHPFSPQFLVVLAIFCVPIDRPLHRTKVGGGPSGLITALALLKNGIHVRIIEKRESPHGGIRGTGITVSRLSIRFFHHCRLIGEHLYSLELSKFSPPLEYWTTCWPLLPLSVGWPYTVLERSSTRKWPSQSRPQIRLLFPMYFMCNMVTLFEADCFFEF